MKISRVASQSGKSGGVKSVKTMLWLTKVVYNNNNNNDL